MGYSQTKVLDLDIYPGSMQGGIRCRYKKDHANAPMYPCDKWTKVQTPVSFKEAMNSGKKIATIEEPFYYHLPWVWLGLLQTKGITKALELINGKWLIKDGD